MLMKKKADAITNTVLTSSPIVATSGANNAINAYNTAVTAAIAASTPIASSVQATAISKIQNLINVYSSYLATVTAGTAAVTYVATAAAPASAAPCVCPGIASSGLGSSLGSTAGGSATFQCGGTPTECPSGAQAFCADKTVIANVSCTPVDGSTNMSDNNGTCPTSLAQIPCNDGINYPLCPAAAPDYGAIPC